MKTVAIPIEIQLTEKQMSAIGNGVGVDAPMAKKVQMVAQSLVKDMANGGIMLPPEAVDRIEAAINDVATERIVESVEQSVNRSGKNVVLKLSIDPGWYPTLKEASESQGRPVEDLMQECIGHAFHNGWLYALPADPPPLWINRDEYEFLKKVIGSDPVFGCDVVNFLRELVARVQAGEHAVV